MRTKYTIRIQQELLDKISQHYATNENLSTSEKLRLILNEAILHQAMFIKKRRRLSPQQTKLALKNAHAFCNPDTCISFRISDEIIHFLTIYYGTSNITQAILCAIYDVINKTAVELPLGKTETIFFMLGQKNAMMLSDLLPIFDELTYTHQLDGYVEPFLGTANVILHTPIHAWELIADNSEDIVNLFCIIQKYPCELKVRLHNIPFTKSSFANHKALLNERFSLLSSVDKKIERAASFYFVKYASVFGQCQSMLANATQTSFMRKLDVLALISNRLQNAIIRKIDANYLLKNMEQTKNSLIYIDAPYIGSEKCYAINNFKRASFQSHDALLKRIQKLSCENAIVISYRITASKSMARNGFPTSKVLHNINRLYYNQGFFYRLVTLKNNQIEIILSNKRFKFANLYCNPIVLHEIEDKALN